MQQLKKTTLSTKLYDLYGKDEFHLHIEVNREYWYYFTTESNIAKKYDLETEIIYSDDPCPVVDYTSNVFKLIEEVAEDVYPGLGVSPYCMTGGTDAKYYTKICDNCIRFAPIYINGQQYGSIHGLNENVNQGALPKAVDFYKAVIKKAHTHL